MTNFTRFFLLLLYLFTHKCFAQEAESIIEEKIEWIAQESNLEEIDFSQLHGILFHYIQHPINLNETNPDELKQLNLLSPFQINALFQHLQKYGSLLSLYEIQTIEYWDEKCIQRILPFIRVSPSPINTKTTFRKIFQEGNWEIIQRSERILEQKKGYSATDSVPPSYLGDPFHLYTSVRFRYKSNLSLGFIGEKDPGETFYSPLKIPYDFHSFHLYYNPEYKLLKKCIIGDYRIGIGQGLTIWNQYNSGKSADVTNTSKGSNSFRPSNGTDESNYLRGFAFDLKHKNFTLTTYGSLKNKDATLMNTDSLFYYSSFPTSGYHRTLTELKSRKTATEKLIGTSLRYSKHNFEIGCSGMLLNFDKELIKTPNNYNTFDFHGKTIKYFSTFYQYTLKNFHFFGEIASNHVIRFSALAQIHGFIICPDKKINLCFLYRNYPNTYYSFFSNGFGNTSNTKNESGFYIGINVQITPKLNFCAYTDLYKKPWISYQHSAPTQNKDYFTQLHFKPNKQLEVHLRYRNTSSENDRTDESEAIPSIILSTKHNFRFHLKYEVNPYLVIQTRFEKNCIQKAKGELIYQEISLISPRKKHKLTFRYSFFNTTNYDTRIYTYESNFPNSSSIPSFSSIGSKYFFVMSNKISPHFHIWIRYGRTSFPFQKTLESGNEEINSNTKNELALQLKFIF